MSMLNERCSTLRPSALSVWWAYLAYPAHEQVIWFDVYDQVTVTWWFRWRFTVGTMVTWGAGQPRNSWNALILTVLSWFAVAVTTAITPSRSGRRTTLFDTADFAVCFEGEVLHMAFQDVAFLPSRTCFCTTFLKKCGNEVNASGPPHVLELWLGVSEGMLPVNYLHSNKSSFCVSWLLWRS